MPPVFSTADLARIQSETYVRAVEYHRQLTSTNDLALELAPRDDVQLPLLVLTEQQTAGRGRGENQWWATIGALTFSLVIETETSGLQPNRWPRVAIATGVAICNVLRQHLPETRQIGLKWPNDVFVDGRKICGILVEPAATPASRLIVGVGINVNNSFDAAPEELKSIATSMFDITWNHSSLADVLIEVLQEVARKHRMLVDADPALVQQWQRLCILRDRTVHLQVGSREVTGVCRGIDEQGALLLETQDNVERHYAGFIRRFE